MGFICNKCGQCCRNLNTKIYEKLHNGDGICFYLDKEKNQCSIYENRPLMCNIEKAYEKYFFKFYSREEFYELNYKGCMVINGERW